MTSRELSISAFLKLSLRNVLKQCKYGSIFHSGLVGWIDTCHGRKFSLRPCFKIFSACKCGDDKQDSGAVYCYALMTLTDWKQRRVSCPKPSITRSYIGRSQGAPKVELTSSPREYSHECSEQLEVSGGVERNWCRDAKARWFQCSQLQPLNR